MGSGRDGEKWREKWQEKVEYGLPQTTTYARIMRLLEMRGDFVQTEHVHGAEDNSNNLVLNFIVSRIKRSKSASTSFNKVAKKKKKISRLVRFLLNHLGLFVFNFFITQVIQDRIKIITVEGGSSDM
jgi:hypothetical protein